MIYHMIIEKLISYSLGNKFSVLRRREDYELSKDKNSFVINRKHVIDHQLLRLITNKASFNILSSNRSVDSQSHSMRRSIEISWTPPPHDYYQINVDGSRKKSSGIFMVNSYVGSKIDLDVALLCGPKFGTLEFEQICESSILQQCCHTKEILIITPYVSNYNIIYKRNHSSVAIQENNFCRLAQTLSLVAYCFCTLHTILHFFMQLSFI